MGLLGRAGVLAAVLAFLAGASYVYDRIGGVEETNDEGTYVLIMPALFEAIRAILMCIMI